MTVYITMIMLSMTSTIIAEKQQKNNKKIFFYLFSIIAILIPSVMAGIRDSGVGTDTKVYIDRVFLHICDSRDLSDVLNYNEIINIEPLYMFLNYYISRISTSLTFFYFCCSLIINTFFYSSFFYYYKKEKIPLFLSYTIFLLLFFNKSLNMNRQMIAMAICFWATRFIYEKKALKYCASIIIGSMLHNSAIFFLPVYYYYYIAINENKKNIIIKFIIVTIILGTVFLLQPTINLLLGLGVISRKYLNYISIYGYSNNINAIEWIPKVFLLITIYLLREPLKKKTKYNNFLTYIFIIECVTFLFGINSMYAQRISYYFEVFLCLLLAQIVEMPKKKSEKELLLVIIILGCTIYSCLYYGIYRFDETIPYIINIKK